MAPGLAGSDRRLSLGGASGSRVELHEDVTLERLASAAAASPRTLARRFQRDIGTTPMRWVAAERIAIAKRLLETTDLPLDRISHDAGYYSPTTFRTSFTADVGVTPGRYRLRFASRTMRP